MLAAGGAGVLCVRSCCDCIGRPACLPAWCAASSSARLQQGQQACAKAAACGLALSPLPSCRSCASLASWPSAFGGVKWGCSSMLCCRPSAAPHLSSGTALKRLNSPRPRSCCCSASWLARSPLPRRESQPWRETPPGAPPASTSRCIPALAAWRCHAGRHLRVRASSLQAPAPAARALLLHWPVRASDVCAAAANDLTTTRAGRIGVCTVLAAAGAAPSRAGGGRVIGRRPRSCRADVCLQPSRAHICCPRHTHTEAPTQQTHRARTTSSSNHRVPVTSKLTAPAASYPGRLTRS